MSNLYHDPLFASLDADAHLARIGGGNETEVYCTDDRRYVVKVKHNQATSLAATLGVDRHTLVTAVRRSYGSDLKVLRVEGRAVILGRLCVILEMDRPA